MKKAALYSLRTWISTINHWMFLKLCSTAFN